MLVGASTAIGSSARRRRDLPGASLPIVPAGLSDHVGIYCFLNAVFGGPSQAEFRESLEAPCYQATDRLLARDGQRIVGHVQVLRRSLWLGTLRLPVAQLDWLGTAPKLQGQGLGTRLLRMAERRMVQDGMLVGWVRSRPSRLFDRLGWADCGLPSWSCGEAHGVLRALMERGFRLPGRRAKLHIRPWLLWEVGSLVRLYRDRVEGLFGPFERTEADWQWLVRRHAFDQLYVAIDGPDLIDMDERKAPVAGYAATKGAQIVELAAPRAKKEVGAMLLARVCHDVIESGRQRVLLHAPAAEPLHELFLDAGGPFRDAPPHAGEAIMARVPRPMALLRWMRDVLLGRAVAAGLPPKFTVGFRVEKKQYELSRAESQVTISPRESSRHTIDFNGADFTRMLLGRLDWEGAMANRRVVPHTAEAAIFARTLFPSIPFWKPPLDDLKRDEGNPY